MVVPDERIRAIRQSIVVSCQAGPESPLNAPHFIAALAQSAERGGAAGFRVDRPENVAAVRAVTTRPILGINKIPSSESEVYITPTFASARAIVEAGADIVALDGTTRARPQGELLEEIICRIHQELGVPVMADVSTVDEGVLAAALGADLVATTLAGYTPYSASTDGPALDVLCRLVQAIRTPVIVEGHIWTTEDVRSCFDSGAYAVVIGSAITVPEFITRRFVAAVPAPSQSRVGVAQ
jgi:N-acylglucosamine-6-phosphate 2-epimerase